MRGLIKVQGILGTAQRAAGRTLLNKRIVRYAVRKIGVRSVSHQAISNALVGPLVAWWWPSLVFSYSSRSDKRDESAIIFLSLVSKLSEEVAQ
jgi:hypothetical protein